MSVKVHIQKMVVYMDETIDIITDAKLMKKKSGYKKRTNNRYKLGLNFFDRNNEDYEIVSIDKLVLKCDQDIYDDLMKPYMIFETIPVQDLVVKHGRIFDMYMRSPRVLNTAVFKDNKDDWVKLPHTLECLRLECSNYNVKDKLPRLPNCKYVDCSFNNITTLSELPVCETLICNNNQINWVFKMPNMKVLICHNNKIKYMSDAEPLDNLEVFDCSNNLIEKMPKLINCKVLKCSNNKFNTLDITPIRFQQTDKYKNFKHLELLDCSHNQIEMLPPLPNCVELNCSNTLIKRLPDLPNCIKLNCKENRQLTFLPNLPKVEEIDCSRTSVDRVGRINNVVKKIVINDMYVNVKCDDVRRNHPQAEVICDSQKLQSPIFKSIPSSFRSVQFGEVPLTTSKEFSQMCQAVQETQDQKLMEKLLALYKNQEFEQDMPIEEEAVFASEPEFFPIRRTFEPEPEQEVVSQPKLISNYDSETYSLEDMYVNELINAETDEDRMGEVLTDMILESNANVFKVIKRYRKMFEYDKSRQQTLLEAWQLIEDHLDLHIDDKDELLERITRKFI